MTKTITLEHKVVTQWEDANGYACHTVSNCADDNDTLAELMIAAGYYYGDSWCLPDCPRCAAGYTEAGGPITVTI
jgi:hypothetical protein